MELDHMTRLEELYENKSINLVQCQLMRQLCVLLAAESILVHAIDFSSGERPPSLVLVPGQLHLEFTDQDFVIVHTCKRSILVGKTYYAHREAGKAVQRIKEKWQSLQ